MKPPRAPILAGLSILLAVLVFLFFRGFAPERIAGPAETAAPVAVGETPAAKEKLKATLFFQRDDDDQLVAEPREIPSTGTMTGDAEAVLNELIKGSANGLVSALPPETRLHQVFLTKDGTAYADFSKELSAAHPSGADAETATVYAIVDTLAFNFKSIKKVFILVDGEERETLNGHVTLDRPFRPDFTRIAKD